MTVSESFASVLRGARADFNSRLVEAKRLYPTLDPAAFTDFLRTSVDGIVSTVGGSRPDRLSEATSALYDIALQLVGQGLAGPGARCQLADRAWRHLLPALAPLLAEYPGDVIGSITNAALYIDRFFSARPDQWLKEMATLSAKVATVSELLLVGQVVAWRSGLAHFREGALRAANELPPALQTAIFGADWTDLHRRFALDPWWSPDNRKQELCASGLEVGAFTGFGGTFEQPPELRAGEGGFLVKSADRYFILIADVFGEVLHPANAEDFRRTPAGAAGSAVAVRGSRLLLGDREVSLDLPAPGLSAVANQHTVAVSSPFTHSIRLFPLRCP